MDSILPMSNYFLVENWRNPASIMIEASLLCHLRNIDTKEIYHCDVWFEPLLQHYSPWGIEPGTVLVVCVVHVELSLNFC